jgi:hypothetical protein
VIARGGDSSGYVKGDNLVPTSWDFLDGFFAAHPPTAGGKIEGELEAQVRGTCSLQVPVSMVKGACLKQVPVFSMVRGAWSVQVPAWCRFLFSRGQGVSPRSGAGFHESDLINLRLKTPVQTKQYSQVKLWRNCLGKKKINLLKFAKELLIYQLDY